MKSQIEVEIILEMPIKTAVYILKNNGFNLDEIDLCSTITDLDFIKAVLKIDHYQKNNNMKSIIMHTILNFVDNNNIDLVEDIFKDKVSPSMLSHLLNKKEGYKRDYDDNTKAWMQFIGNLDAENSEIIFNYINKKK
ncbi:MULTISPECIES: hypothetical protein [unclassified Chryseobacterium]|uniref:hypothetical protein n=1 Tax=unclassified Chryseobacterium TaxID=2593645 RepID=UPI0028533A07|nr:hypothetical protein [Chryseobacterium sp. CFS7]MDR4895116.1 hypothetical protein [Chryseobacterium sp. CFS7]